MMWVFFTFFISFLSSKRCYFFTTLFEVEVRSLLVVLLGPFNIFIFRFFSFFSENWAKWRKLFLSMAFILTIVSLRFLCNSPFTFLILLETSVLPTALLIILLSKDKDKLISVFLMIVINLRGSLPFICYSILYLDWVQVRALTNLNRCFSFVIMFRFLFMLCSKVPVSIFHFWLTKAHVSARACVSIILASILLKLGTYGLIKFMSSFNKICSTISSFFFPWCLTFCFFFSLLMIRFVDIKILVALSSILHISLILPMLSLGSSIGAASIIFIMLGHGLVSYFFFLLVRVMYERSLRRSTHYNKSRESHYRALFLIIFSLSFLNIGVPPLVNFLREVLACSSLFSYCLPTTLIFLLSIIVRVFFCILLVTKRNFGRKFSFVDKELESTMRLSFYLFLFILLLIPVLY